MTTSCEGPGGGRWASQQDAPLGRPRQLPYEYAVRLSACLIDISHRQRSGSKLGRCYNGSREPVSFSMVRLSR